VASLPAWWSGLEGATVRRLHSRLTTGLVDDADATLGFGIENLNDELDVLFGHRVDLVARGALHPRMRDHVLAQARVLYTA
jgi:hypothetical protein